MVESYYEKAGDGDPFLVAAVAVRGLVRGLKRGARGGVCALGEE